MAGISSAFKSRIGLATAGLALASFMAFAPSMLRAEQPAATNSVGAAKPAKAYTIVMGEMLDQDTKSLHMTVMAVKQPEGTTGYLINGMGDNRVWCQLGLAYDPKESFSIVAQAWLDGRELYNKKFVAEIKEGNQVSLGMVATNNSVVMHATVEGWPSPFYMTVSNVGVTTFKGLPKGSVSADNREISVPQIGTCVMTEIHTENRDIRISPQWYQIDAPAITNRVIPFIVVSSTTNNFINASTDAEFKMQTVFPHGPASDRVHWMGGGNLNLFFQNGDLLTTQSSTNFTLPGR